MVEEVFRYFISIKIAILQCKNTLLQVEVLHSKYHLRKNTKVSESKYTSSTKSKSIDYANYPISGYYIGLFIFCWVASFIILHKLQLCS